MTGQMGTNRNNDAMYEFWSQYGFDADDTKSLTAEFSGTTLEQMILMSREVLETRIKKVRLSPLHRLNALKAVLSQQNNRFRPPLQRGNLSTAEVYANDPFYRNHKLYQQLGIFRNSTAEQIKSALQGKKEARLLLVKQHKTEQEKQLSLLQQTARRQKKQTDDLLKEHDNAFATFTLEIYRNNYEKFGDERTSTPPPRLPTSRPSNQIYPYYPPPDHPPPAHLVAKYAREKEVRQNNIREERRLRNLHQGIERAY